MRNAKPGRVGRGLIKQNQAERDKVSNKVRPSFTRCEETRLSGTLLSENWAGPAGSTKFSEATLGMTRFNDARKGDLNLRKPNEAAYDKRPSKVWHGLTSLNKIREDGI